MFIQNPKQNSGSFDVICDIIHSASILPDIARSVIREQEMQNARYSRV